MQEGRRAVAVSWGFSLSRFYCDASQHGLPPGTNKTWAAAPSRGLTPGGTLLSPLQREAGPWLAWALAGSVAGPKPVCCTDHATSWSGVEDVSSSCRFATWSPGTKQCTRSPICCLQRNLFYFSSRFCKYFPWKLPFWSGYNSDTAQAPNYPNFPITEGSQALCVSKSISSAWSNACGRERIGPLHFPYLHDFVITLIFSSSLTLSWTCNRSSKPSWEIRHPLVFPTQFPHPTTENKASPGLLIWGPPGIRLVSQEGKLELLNSHLDSTSSLFAMSGKCFQLGIN